MKIDVYEIKDHSAITKTIDVEGTNLIRVLKNPIRTWNKNGTFKKFLFTHFFTIIENGERVTYKFFSLSGKDSNFGRLVTLFKEAHGNRVKTARYSETEFKKGNERKATGYSYALKD